MKSLSILIPQYNQTCVELVRALAEQAKNIKELNFEILVGDDSSTLEGTIFHNRQINELENCHFLEYPENLGRAALRNSLAECAHYDNLLFIDSDARVCSPAFINAYVEAVAENEVVCGGVKNIEKIPSSDVSLRYRYEEAAKEKRTLEYRRHHPYSNFTTFNFLIKRGLFLSMKFDENCTEYGYEDTLFGLELGERGVEIHHIDNPLVHTGMDANREFLLKTETALRTLCRLDKKMQDVSPVSLAVRRLHRFHLLWLVRLNFRFFAPLLKRQLLSSRPSLFLFNIYKLGYFATINRG